MEFPLSLSLVALRDSHLHAGTHVAAPSLDESGNPPLSSVHNLKKNKKIKKVLI